MKFSHVRWLFALVLFFSSIAKLLSIELYGFVESVLFPNLTLLNLVISVELALAIWLVFGQAEKLTRVLLLSMLLLMILSNAYLIFSGEESCGCFGQFVSLSPGFMLVFDVILYAVLVVSIPKERSNAQFGLIKPTAVALAVLGVSFAGIRATVATENQLPIAKKGEDSTQTTSIWSGLRPVKYKLLKYEPLVGGALPLLDFVETPYDLNEGNWIFFFRNIDCKNCARVLPKFAEYSSQSTAIKYAIVDLQPTLNHSREYPSGELVWASIKLPGNERMVARPGFMEVADGKVLFASSDLEASLEYVRARSQQASLVNKR